MALKRPRSVANPHVGFKEYNEIINDKLKSSTWDKVLGPKLCKEAYKYACINHTYVF